LACGRPVLLEKVFWLMDRCIIQKMEFFNEFRHVVFIILLGGRQGYHGVLVEVLDQLNAIQILAIIIFES
jgi:hypothetical protein